ncbi:MAG: formate dehydrogenase accessory sulfurtransferase FdhD [Candidatus Methanoperedens sp.]|nr:formate dehydrogenase accessory sulfurtransferase FdhD [Candidatus Methanoperedens sp.]MCE8428410.1 formate dehydrogenase accessory sulfurtransferase FdhD [Candidatus Methanoperedens sp.]
MKESWHAEKAGKWTSYWKDEVHDPCAPYILTKCVEISADVRKKLELDVVEEESIKIMLDGRHLVTLLALPGELRELAAGFLICEGVLKGIGDIRSISVQDDTVFCQSSLDDSELELWTEVRSSGCIGIKSSWEGIETITSSVRMEKEVLLNAIEQIKEKGKIWRRTGGTHSSLICTSEGDIVSFCEDVSRACSVDKAAGAALLSGRDISNCALVTTGRLSGGMVAKVARAGIPIVVSKAAPLSTGVMLSKMVGMTLVAFVRNPNLYVYSGEERII